MLVSYRSMGKDHLRHIALNWKLSHKFEKGCKFQVVWKCNSAKRNCVKWDLLVLHSSGISLWLPFHISLQTPSGWWISVRTSRAISNIHCQVWEIYLLWTLWINSEYIHSIGQVHSEFWLTLYKQCWKLTWKFLAQRVTVFRLSQS